MNHPVVLKMFEHEDGSVREAVYSPCTKYRYSLTLRWNTLDNHRLVFLLLNPSTATEEANDPTVERCYRRARDLGYDSLTILNLFAYRAPAPAEMKSQEDPIGPANDFVIGKECSRSNVSGVLCGWGERGSHRGRAREVIDKLQDLDVNLYCLKVNNSGNPIHPLYVSYETEPVRFNP